MCENRYSLLSRCPKDCYQLELLLPFILLLQVYRSLLVELREKNQLASCWGIIIHP